MTQTKATFQREVNFGPISREPYVHFRIAFDGQPTTVVFEGEDGDQRAQRFCDRFNATSLPLEDRLSDAVEYAKAGGPIRPSHENKL